MQMHCMDKVSVANLYIFNCARFKKKKKSHLFWSMINTLLEKRLYHNLRMLAMSGVGIVKK